MACTASDTRLLTGSLVQIVSSVLNLRSNMVGREFESKNGIEFSYGIGELEMPKNTNAVGNPVLQCMITYPIWSPSGRFINSSQ